MKKSSIYIAVALACSLAVAGCNSKEKQLMGKWKVDTTKLPASMTTGAQAAFAKGFLSAFTVEFKSDKKFTMTVIIPIEGTWTLDSSTVTMTPTSMMGMNMDQVKQQMKNAPNSSMTAAQQDPGKPINATLSDDGKSLTLSVPGQKDTLTFVKDSS